MDEQKEVDYDKYSVVRTFSIKLKNVMKIDELSKKENINKSRALNKIIEEYGK